MSRVLSLPLPKHITPNYTGSFDFILTYQTLLPVDKNCLNSSSSSQQLWWCQDIASILWDVYSRMGMSWLDLEFALYKTTKVNNLGFYVWMVWPTQFFLVGSGLWTLTLTWWLVDYTLCLEAQAAYLFLTTPMSRGLGDVKNQIKFKITVTRYRKDFICGCIVCLNLSSFVGLF